MMIWFQQIAAHVWRVNEKLRVMDLNTIITLLLMAMAAFVVLVEISWMVYLASRTWAMYCAGKKANETPRAIATEPTEAEIQQFLEENPPPGGPGGDAVTPTGAITARDVLGDKEWAKIELVRRRNRVDSLNKILETMSKQQTVIDEKKT